MRAAQDLVSVVELARQDCNVSTLRMALLLVLGRIDGVEHRNPGTNLRSAGCLRYRVSTGFTPR